MKCKYWKQCEGYVKNSYTCNHESDADGYCGIREIDKLTKPSEDGE